MISESDQAKIADIVLSSINNIDDINFKKRISHYNFTIDEDNDINLDEKHLYNGLVEFFDIIIVALEQENTLSVYFKENKNSSKISYFEMGKTK